MTRKFGPGVEAYLPSATPGALADQAILDERNKYRAALTQIAKSPHCQYNNYILCDGRGPNGGDYGDRQYQIGVADGHRCCAETARKALGGK